MEERLHELKDNFTTIVSTREDVIFVMETVNQRIEKLKEMYSDFIKNNKKNLFVFGLDSFHFQSKLIDIEYEDMKRMFQAINNRMYCEYYKLYKIVTDYITHHVTDKKILESIKTNNNFPVYKDLEPFKVYKFEHVQELHENIVLLLNSICNYLTSKSYELQNHETKRYIGLNIDNFVNTFSYDIFIMREKVNLFISYIEFFHNLHGKFLSRFSKKMQFMMDQLNSDVNFEKKDEIKNVEKREGRFQKMFQSGVKKVGNVLSFIQKSQHRETEEDRMEVMDTKGKDVNIEMFVNPLEEMCMHEKHEAIVEPVEILIESVTETMIDKMVEHFGVVDEPVVEEPVVEEPVVQEPVVQEPVLEEPVLEEPVLEEPVLEEPVLEEPLVE